MARYGQFFIGFVVDRHTDAIADCGVSTAIAVTDAFVKDILVGKKMAGDADAIGRELELRYFASSQKAILTAYKDAEKKYADIRRGVNARKIK